MSPHAVYLLGRWLAGEIQPLYPVHGGGFPGEHLGLTERGIPNYWVLAGALDRAFDYSCVAHARCDRSLWFWGGIADHPDLNPELYCWNCKAWCPRAEFTLG